MTRIDSGTGFGGRSGADGSFALPLPIRDHSYLVDLGARADGYLLQFDKDVEIRPHGIVHDFHLEVGGRIAGTVFGPTGAPLAAVSLFSTQDPHLNQKEGLATTWSLDRANVRLASRERYVTEAESITDESGQFALCGLQTGDYLIVSHSHQWIWSPVRARTGDEAVVVTASEPAGIHVEARDSETREPIPKFNIELNSATLNSRGDEVWVTRAGSGLNGVLDMNWLPKPGAKPSGEFKFLTMAAGYEPVRLDIQRPETGIAKAQVDMTRRALGVVRMRVQFENGEPVRDPLAVDYAEPVKGIRRTVPATSKEPGDYEFLLPPERWFLWVRRVTDAGSGAGWHGEIAASSDPHGERVMDQVVLARGSEIRLVARPEAPTDYSVELSSANCIVARICHEPDSAFTGLPSSQWHIRVAHGQTQLWEGTVSVGVDDVVRIDFP
jgi:hypothetical protein